MPGPKKKLNPAAKYFAAAVLIIAVLLIIPIPARLLDILISVNLLFALYILVTALYAKKTGDIPLFPTIVLIFTVFCLAVNLSAARMALVKGADINGFLIRHAGSLMTGSGRINLYAGLGIFFVVYTGIILFIAKGATRIAEVSARFALDSLPGKQMAIDVAFSTGSISMKEAETQKKDILDELDFLASLDGTGKFLQGNVKAGIIITAGIIIGGTVMDCLLRGNSIAQALETYAFLAIGCGILSIVPVFLVSIAVGIMASKAAGSKNP